MDKRAMLLLVLFFMIPVSCGDNTGTAVDEKPRIETDTTQSQDKRTLPANLNEHKSAGDQPAGPAAAAESSHAPYADKATTAASAMLKAAAKSGAVKQEPSHPGFYPPPPLPRPGAWNRESYDAIEENRFINSVNDPLSTFSIDVDTASYANVRRFISGGALPPKGAVRTEEMINYFNYSFSRPEKHQPFSLQLEAGQSPFHKDYKLVKIGLKARDFEQQTLPPSNLVFLVDVSGSMNQPNKLPLLKQSLKLLLSQLSAQDRLAIVVYAGSDRVVLQPTAGDDTATIAAAIENLQGGGSTHASSGILTAYELAGRSYMPGGNNRVILASDGDFNVGITSRSELQTLIEDKRKSGIYLTVLGFGNGNYHDDTMEILADKGNGNYAYIDSLLEAKKVLIKERSGTLFTLANDVKIQVEFNPARVGAYRLIGYENRALADEDFRDDSKDAGEIGMGHTVTALYEIIPAGHVDVPGVEALKYQKPPSRNAAAARELLTVKLRYKPKGSETSTQIAKSLADSDIDLGHTSSDFRFAAAVAGFAMLLKESEHVGTFGWDDCLNLAKQSRGSDEHGYRAEFTRLVEMAQLLQQQG